MKIELDLSDQKRIPFRTDARHVCKSCGEILSTQTDYLSYPVEGKTITLYFYCEDCELEYEREYIFINPCGILYQKIPT